MNNKEKNNIKINDYFSNAMLVFLAMGLDVVAVIGVNALIFLDTWYKKIITNSITIFIWTIASILVYKYIHKNNLKNFITLNLNKKIVTYFISILILLISLNLMIKGGKAPHFITEFITLKYKYKNYGICVYTVQNIYYLLEALLVTFIIAFGQIWGELKFNFKQIPYGGIVLSLSWGLVHILTQGISTGIFTFIMSIIAGMGFLLCEKNFVLTYALVCCIFLI